MLVALVALVALWGSLLALSPSPAHADATVNRAGNAPDTNPGNGRCDTSSTRGIQCTLRAAIQETNVTETVADPDVIRFNIGDTDSVKTISPLSPLPAIIGPTFIDGYTQRGARENTLEVGNDAVLKVQLSGTGAGTGASGLQITGSNCTIKGLVINGFDAHGIEITGSGETFNRVEGNFIGTNARGTADRGNARDGVRVNSDRNFIGGTQPAQRNVVSGNDGTAGVTISGTGTTDNEVEGNYIGTNAEGTQDLGNTRDGVSILNAHDNLIGGTAGGARNVLSGNGASGVEISGANATGNRVEGNRIGTNAAGSGNVGNSGFGVSILSASDNIVGGEDSSAGNDVSGNGANLQASGVGIFGPQATGNRVVGNTIRLNGSSGVILSSGTGNSILSNRIFGNEGLGIDFDADGVTLNDTGDSDGGSNNRQNFPRIKSAIRDGSTLTVSGTLNSTSSQTFTIQCFLASPDPSRHGEGRSLFAEATVTTSNVGNANFSCTDNTVGFLVPGQQVTATATNTTTGDTSEFSTNVLVRQ
jgi:hypothetical protein